MSRREIGLCFLAAALALPAFVFGRGLLSLISAFNGLFGPLGLWAPALGGLIVGLIARYGSAAVRGHGIPEVIENVLTNESRVHPKVALLKPLCSAISIGSGGPFGAEGPVIGLGGSLGSLLGQWLPVSAYERRVLLAAGAAAGVTAVFGCPMAAVLLSLELLLYEFQPASSFAVGMAAATSGALRLTFYGNAPMFPMGELIPPTGSAVACYLALGIPLGFAATGISHLVHLSEDLFAKLPLHWMWWPALGGLMVGLISLAEPRVLGPSYSSIGATLDGSLIGQALCLFVALKLCAWVLALGSGTAGGTLAPLFGIGAGLGALLVMALNLAFPSLALDPRMGALIGMAAVFAGASRALLASILIALETTHQFSGSLPILGACLSASAASHWLHPHSLMTHRLAKKGIEVPKGARSDIQHEKH